MSRRTVGAVQTFHVPEDVKELFAIAGRRGDATAAAWADKFKAYQAAHPAKAAELQRRIDGELPPGWESCLPRFDPTTKSDATRNWSGQVLIQMAKVSGYLQAGAASAAVLG